MYKKFRYYQIEAFKYCLTVKNPLLFLDMRLGKSLIIIRLIDTLFTKGNVLIISPYSSLFGWKEELLSEGNDTSQIVIGTRDQRIDLINDGYNKTSGLNYILTNPTYYKTIHELTDLKWQAIIIDEPTFLRNPRTEITNYYFKNIRVKNCLKAGLTGLPAPEGEYEYFPLCKTVEPEIFSESNYYQFEHNNFGILPNHRRILNARGGKYISGQLAKYCYFLSRQDVNLGGTVIKEAKYCFMPNKTRKVYQKVEDEFLLLVNSIEMTTIFSVTQYLWCRRLCAGMIENEILDSSKLDLLQEFLFGELKNQQVIIWCHYNDEIERIISFLKGKGVVAESIHGGKSPVARENVRKDFQSGIYQIVVCQTRAFQFGANLSAAKTQIYFSLPESLLTYAQTESRFVNISNNDPLLTIYLIMYDTVEESIYKGLIKKEGKFQLIKRIVQDIQRRVKC